MFSALVLVFHRTVPAIFEWTVFWDWDWRSIGKPTPAESLPPSVTMRACAFPGNCFKALFRNKIWCNTLRCHFLSFEWFLMIMPPYIYDKQQRGDRSLHFWAWRESIACFKNLYSKESGQFELGDEIYAAFAGVLIRTDASRRSRTDTSLEGRRGQRTVSGGRPFRCRTVQSSLFSQLALSPLG